MRDGDSGAAQDLLPLVYAELHRIASAFMRRERSDHTLQPTALINEAYLRLVGEDVEWSNRAHFIGLSAHVMRQVLVDYARQHNAERRAGGLKRVEMEDNLAIARWIPRPVLDLR
ncbi:MAG TPA: ECF-type sigma factor [Terracidiphilus sp.]